MRHMKRTLSFILALAIVCMISMLKDETASAETMIPVVTIEAPSLENWWGKEDVREATLTYRDFSTGVSFTRAITIKPQGSSSLNYLKKNFTIQMTEEAVQVNEAWGVQSKYCLKANYVDPTHACNIVSARLAARMNEAYGLHEQTPNRGLIDGFPVWVILNGQDAGLYTWNIPKAAWMFGMDEENENHIVMACEEWTEGCNMLRDYYELDAEWSLEVGSNTSATIEKFTRLLRFVSTASDEEFKANFDQYLNLDACLNYYCYICISDAWDNSARNMLMATWDGQVWYPMLYDLDSLWGIYWDGQSTTEAGVVDVFYNGNRLFARIRDLYGDELRARYAELRDDILSVDSIKAAFYEFVETIPSGCYAMDQAMWNSEGLRIRTLDLMWQMMDTYLPQIDAEFGYNVDAAPVDEVTAPLPEAEESGETPDDAL